MLHTLVMEKRHPMVDKLSCLIGFILRENKCQFIMEVKT